ncbi:hypothetical protein PR048_011670 [Dryococelus australis]|uniref:Uncharacterized protein n=1 Tax=Dryococelus australis TaxID=614101 RepID=A0ABQ9HNI4_9NEOP|nr:hypothetical protein PR048_011670 [Dryococelus australis]
MGGRHFDFSRICGRSGRLPSINRFVRLLTARSREPMRVVEVNMERRRNEEAGEGGRSQGNPPTNGIVRHDFHSRKPGDPAGDWTRFALVGRRARNSTNHCLSRGLDAPTFWLEPQLAAPVTCRRLHPWLAPFTLLAPRRVLAFAKCLSIGFRCAPRAEFPTTLSRYEAEGCNVLEIAGSKCVHLNVLQITCFVSLLFSHPQRWRKEGSATRNNRRCRLIQKNYKKLEILKAITFHKSYDSALARIKTCGAFLHHAYTRILLSRLADHATKAKTCAGPNRYTQHDENTARQFRALRLAAMGDLIRVAVSPLTLRRLSASSAEKSSTDSGGAVARALASHHGDPGSIIGGPTPGFSQVGIVLDDAGLPAGFFGVLPLPPPPNSSAAPC